MIKLDKNKPKTIKMDVNVQGIDKTKLKFNFKIELDDISIGFKPELIGDNKLKINIPSLSSKIFNVEPGRYRSCLEINDGEKYFLKPWEGEVVIEEEPVITASIDEDEQLDPANVKVNFVDEDYKPKANVKNVRENKKMTKPKKEKPKEKMTKEAAIKFIQEAKKKFKNEDKEIVDRFISEKLREHGFKYKPENINENKKQKSKEPKIETKTDVLNYLKKSGIKSESTLSSLMETLDAKSGGDVNSMFDMANRMINPNQNTQFNDANDVYSFLQNQQQYSGMGGMTEQSNSQYVEGQEYDNLETDDGLSIPAGSNSNLMEQIQKAKADLNNKINS